MFGLQTHERTSEWHQGGGPPRHRLALNSCTLDRRPVTLGLGAMLLSSGWQLEGHPTDCRACGCQGLKSPAVHGLLHWLGSCTHKVLPALLLGKTWEVAGRSQALRHHWNPIRWALVGRVTWDWDSSGLGQHRYANFPHSPSGLPAASSLTSWTLTMGLAVSYPPPFLLTP